MLVARRCLTVLALIVISAIATNLRQLVGYTQLSLKPSIDEVVDHEKRLAPLKNVLPTRGAVGYMTDAPTGYLRAKGQGA